MSQRSPSNRNDPLNVVTQLMGLIVIALMLNALRAPYLWYLFIFCLLPMLLRARGAFFSMLKRLKWVLIVMVLLLGLNIPGEHMQWGVTDLLFTYEGLNAALAQGARILCILALLAYISATHTRAQLISGFYYLLTPLTGLGWDTQRFAVRLWLTLHYVESQPKTTADLDFMKQFQQQWAALFEPSEETPMTITLERPQFTIIDYAAMTILGAFVALILLGI